MRARAILPVTAVLAATLLIAAIVDVLDGHVPLIGETQHIPEMISVFLVWLLAIAAPRDKLTASTRPSTPFRLRAVKDDRQTG